MKSSRYLRPLFLSLAVVAVTAFFSLTPFRPALAFDYPDEPVPDAAAPTGATMGPGGAIQFGWYWPKLGALNDELKSMGLPALGGSFCIGGTFRWSLDSHWQVGYTGGGWGLSSAAIVDGVVKEATLGFSFHNLGVFYKFYPLPQWTATVGLGTGYYSVKYEKSITAGIYRYGDGQTPADAPTSLARLSGSAWGGEAMLGLSCALGPVVSISGEASYLKAYISSLVQANQIMADAPPVDLGGWLVRLGLQLNL